MATYCTFTYKSSSGNSLHIILLLCNSKWNEWLLSTIVFVKKVKPLCAFTKHRGFEKFIKIVLGFLFYI